MCPDYRDLGCSSFEALQSSLLSDNSFTSAQCTHQKEIACAAMLGKTLHGLHATAGQITLCIHLGHFPACCIDCIGRLGRK